MSRAVAEAASSAGLVADGIGALAAAAEGTAAGSSSGRRPAAGLDRRSRHLLAVVGAFGV